MLYKKEAESKKHGVWDPLSKLTITPPYSISTPESTPTRLPWDWATLYARAGIFKQSMGARNRAGKGLSYRPARPHRLAEFIPWIPGLHKRLKIRAQSRLYLPVRDFGFGLSTLLNSTSKFMTGNRVVARWQGVWIGLNSNKYSNWGIRPHI